MRAYINLLAFMIGFALPFLLFSNSAHASGFSYNSKCYSSFPAVTDAFMLSFPSVSNGKVITVSNATSSVPAIQFTSTVLDLSTGASSVMPASVMFPDCDDSSYGWSGVEQNALIFWGAMTFFFIVGVRMGWLL